MKKNMSLSESTASFDLRLYDDWVFHWVFGQDTPDSKNALMAVLNIVRGNLSVHHWTAEKNMIQ